MPGSGTVAAATRRPSKPSACVSSAFLNFLIFPFAAEPPDSA